MTVDVEPKPVPGRTSIPEEAPEPEAVQDQKPEAAEDQKPAAVEVRDLTFSYPGRLALDGVTFRVEPGILFGFLGPNGGGKTTLFRILATLLPAGGGTVRIFGHGLPAEAAAARRRLGVVFQSPSLDLQLSIQENLTHQGHLYGLRGRELAGRIDDALARLGLADRRRERGESLSGGLRRRAEIAKALLHRPDVMLLDEPSTGLDPGARRDLWRTLGELRSSGMTVLLTTHYIEEAGRADHLLLLDRGRIVAGGSPRELMEEIGGDVVSLVPRGGEAAAETFARELGERFPDIEPTVREGTVRFERDRAHELVARLAEAFPGRIDAITVARPTLEDVFLRHTGHALYERTEGKPGEVGG